MIGQKISHYQILQKIGAGGMGEVYLADDTTLKRRVALKFLPVQLTRDQQANRRFMLEAQAASSLDHPNICTIHGIEETSDGRLFIVMAHCRGETLKEKIDRGPLPLEQALDIASQVAAGLGRAHQQGIVHRDIKPANILVGDDELVKILDFGLAKLIGQKSATRPEQALGTVAYMSPEQAMGRRAGEQTDIWSLGVVLYEMVAGRKPYTGEYDQALLYAIVNEQPPDIARIRGGIPSPLRTILTRCLNKEPAERYPHMTDLLADLNRLQEEFGVHRPGQKRSFSRTLVILAFGAILALLIFYLPRFIGRNASALPVEKHLAILPLNIIGNGETERAFADGLVEIISSRLTQLERRPHRLLVVPVSELRADNIDSPGRARQAMGANLAVTGSIRYEGDGFRLTLNLVDTRALRQIDSADLAEPAIRLPDLQERAVSELARMLGLESPAGKRPTVQEGGSADARAWEMYVQARGFLQRYEQVKSLNQALLLLRQAIDHDPGFALAYAGLGETCWRLYELSRTPHWVEEAKQNCQRAVQLNSGISAVFLTLGMIDRGTGQNKSALTQLHRALTLDPANATASLELALVYETLGRLDEAEQTYRQVIDRQPNSWSGYNYLGVFYYLNGRSKQAEEMFRRVIDLTPDNVRGYYNLGAVFMLSDRTVDAQRLFERSLRISPNPTAYSNLGTIHYLSGRYAEAAAMYEAGARLTPDDYQMFGNLADAYRRLPGAEAKAKAAYQKAIALIQQALAVNANDAHMHASQALYQVRGGSREKALAEISQARQLAAGDLGVLFNSILVNELAGQRDQTLAELQRYLDLGGKIDERFKDPDLGGLRQDRSFNKLVNNHKEEK